MMTRFRRHQGTRAQLIVAAIISLAVLNPAGASAQLGDTRYVDPNGYFRIVPPAGWRVQQYLQDPRGKVAFLGPEPNVAVGVLVEEVDFETLEEGIAVLRDIEKRLGAPTNMKRITFLERPAVERLFEWRGLKRYYIDLVLERAAHNLAYSAPPHLWNKYRVLAMRSLETYEPLGKKPSNEQATAHAVAKSYRLAQLMAVAGNLGLAQDYVKEGLELDPGHTGLLKLKNEIESRLKAR